MLQQRTRWVLTTRQLGNSLYFQFCSIPALCQLTLEFYCWWSLCLYFPFLRISVSVFCVCLGIRPFVCFVSIQLFIVFPYNPFHFSRGWDGWMASPIRWTWVWVNSGSWWWTRRAGVLWFMRSQRVGHDWATELNWSFVNVTSFVSVLDNLSLFSFPWPVWLKTCQFCWFSQGNNFRFIDFFFLLFFYLLKTSNKEKNLIKQPEENKACLLSAEDLLAYRGRRTTTNIEPKGTTLKIPALNFF